MSRSRFSFICLLLLTAALGPLHTWGQELFVKHYTVDDGLPSNETYRVLEDKAGNLLIATDRGIARFDGYSFEKLYIRNAETVTPVYEIYPAASGNIYFPGPKGQLYVYRDGILNPYAYNNKIASSDSNGGFLIADAVIEDRGALYVKYNNNLSSFIRISADGQLSRQEDRPGIHFDLARGFFYKTFNERNLENTTQPVFITWKDGTSITDSVHLSWRSGYLRNPYYITQDGADIFCVGRQLLFYRHQQLSGKYLLAKDPLSIAALPSGHIAIGFENGGVELYRLDGNTLYGPLRTYLAPLSISSIHTDFQGGYWFSTLDDGLLYVYPSKAELWQDDSRITFMTQSNGEAYILHKDGEIHLFRNGHYENKISVPIKNGEQLIGASFDLKGNPIASSNHGFYFLNANKWQFHSGLDKLLLQTEPNVAYGAGIVDATLHQYNVLTGKLVKSIPLHKRILSMLQDSAKGVWLGTMEGLYHYDEQNGLQHAKPDYPAFQDRIVSLKRLADGTLAIATLGSGLVLWHGQDMRLVNARSGLATPIINDMEVDGNTIWLGTNNGLSELVLNGDSIRFHHYNGDYGLPTVDVHAFTISDGWLYLKWINSTVAINLQSLRRLTPSHGAFITAVYLDGKKVTGVSRFNHNQNSLLIAFSSINFACGDHQQYRYRLLGFKQDWRYTTERQVAYTNLPPGNYSFQVQVEGAQEAFNAPVVSYSFRIAPAFWQHWWFELICVLAGVALLLFLFRLRLQAVRRHNQLRLELANSQQKALTQLISPHFIFNVLNTAQSFILREDKLKAASFISRIARLLRLSLEVGKERYITVEKEVELLTKYVELEESRIEGKFSCFIEVAPEINTIATKIPGMLVQPFVENAIKHGTMHLTDRKGHICVRFEMKEELLLCSIEDNGVGRAKAAGINAGSQSTHQSLGIGITRKRLELLHREHESEYLFEIRDLHSGQAIPCGTKIIFSIPYILRS